ncbi:hypothetical protein [Streptomyces sp. NBC_00140]|uniref:hypothetical protein n=1 Tax=unclassified Streptomyces TaxID=2593676 RepID=UPI002253664A|nr:hypothetical protein [Streptomyces sp. NBC_00140]MCX5329335.1 hypothetical protein [Streptomyces sp. NBC_00140]
MGFDGQVWHLHSGDVPVGEILIDEADFPWLSGRFTAAPAFDTLRELFARELALTEDPGEEWERVHDEVRRRVSLTSPEGPVPEFLLHIEGDRAWFRWSDKPFDE